MTNDEQKFTGDILLVGEISTNISLLIPLLTFNGYEVRTTLNGERLLEIVQSMPPDIILLNVALTMPDSYTICQRAKRIDKVKEIPILFVNSDNPKFKPASVFESGGADYITYPFIEQEVLARIKNQIKIAYLQKQLQQKEQELENTMRDYAKLEADLGTANEEVRQYSPIDSLTRVANRRYFEEYLQQQWRRCARDRVTLGDSNLTVVSVILCDLDEFQEYNNYYGFRVGDDSLTVVAQTIRQVVKRPADLVARYGGDQFAILLPNTPLDGAIKLAELIQLEMRKLKITHTTAKKTKFLTLSFAVVAKIPSNVLSPTDLMTTAGTILLQAQREGGNRILSDQVIEE